MRDALDSSKHEDHEALKGVKQKTFVLKILAPENIWAFVLFLIALALIIFTSDSSPIWIYQGF